MAIRADSRLGRFIGALGYRPAPSFRAGTRRIRSGGKLGQYVGALASPVASRERLAQPTLPEPHARQSAGGPPSPATRVRQQSMRPLRPVLDAPQGSLEPTGGGLATEVRITSEEEQDLTSLGEWLSREYALIRQFIVSDPGEAAADLAATRASELVLEVIRLGDSAAVFASAMRAWLSTRRTSVTITVRSADRSVRLEVDGRVDVAAVVALLRQALDDQDESGAPPA
jgi:Effector Associated Constant Component 1